MLKQILLTKKINRCKEKLEEYLTKRSELKEEAEQLERALDEVSTDEEMKDVEESADELTKQLDEINAQITALEEEKQKLEDELAAIEEETDEAERGAKQMPKREKIKNDEEMTYQERAKKAINGYVHRQERAVTGFKTTDGEVLIPEEILQAYKKPIDQVDLKQYVRTVKVNSKSGKMPVIKRSEGVMNTVAELAENPELAKPTFDEIAYDIDTYRGYIPVSQEVIDDADYDVTGLVAEAINDQTLNTTNKAIATVVKGLTAKEVTGVDGLKDLINKDIKKVYNVKLYISSSLYAALDKLKDKNGRYLLQDSITAASGKVLLGKEVVVLDDDVIGTNADDMVGFVGDLDAAVAYFDRAQTTLRWTENQIYGQLLSGVVRFDVQKVDTDAGFYITYTDAPSV
ncbi:phage major capsid protein [Enterococcus cecorum]|uniref:phage major capsid protein n=1 Tax=Enterococcus cecorum TaxID=44008 RepID=UPI0022D72A7E|nr:phage major capsid protein [Enterococcus cecorum]CAI3332985.1 phage major capsid protein [Enterococcus cecorum]CAI3390280.1 phage major capsid protein [Enterococcus cecorum]CAI3421696.1 phage major capsid protein [Enterococcus cecorum]CAI3497773.1 phage major capsid protein [Enterococcus cecorum]